MMLVSEMNESLATKKVNSLSHGERVGERGYGPSMDLNPAHPALRADLSRRER
jgi:hypothetical protein